MTRDGGPWCDFCVDDEPLWFYPADDFRLIVAVDAADDPLKVKAEHWSRGGWAACIACAYLIDRDDWKGLAVRAVTRYLILNPGSTGDKVAPIMADTHDGFRTHRAGARVGFG